MLEKMVMGLLYHMAALLLTALVTLFLAMAEYALRPWVIRYKPPISEMFDQVIAALNV